MNPCDLPLGTLLRWFNPSMLAGQTGVIVQGGFQLLHSFNSPYPLPLSIITDPNNRLVSWVKVVKPYKQVLKALL